MDEPTADEVADVLDKAADVLLTDGWCPDGEGEEGGPYCTVVAVQRASGGLVMADAAVDTLAVALGLEPGTYSAVRVGEWNDHPSTTEDDVHDLLRSTAKALREAPR